jgi:hypothetical protein
MQRLNLHSRDTEQELLLAHVDEHDSFLTAHRSTRNNLDYVARGARREPKAGVRPAQQNDKADNDYHAGNQVHDVACCNAGCIHPWDLT